MYFRIKSICILVFLLTTILVFYSVFQNDRGQLMVSAFVWSMDRSKSLVLSVLVDQLDHGPRLEEVLFKVEQRLRFIHLNFQHKVDYVESLYKNLKDQSSELKKTDPILNTELAS